jgi:hypothetical protein
MTRIRHWLTALGVGLCVGLAWPVFAAEPTAFMTQAKQQVTATQAREAALYWRNFRQALLQGQNQLLVGMTRLPLVVKGVTDDQAPRRVGQGKLGKTLAELLKQEVYPVHATDDRPQSLRHLIEATPELLPRHWTTPQQLRVENLAFAKGKTGWKLVTVYEEAP